MCFCIEIQQTNNQLLAEDSVADAKDQILGEDSDPGMAGGELDDEDELDDEEQQIAAVLLSLSVASRVENPALVNHSLQSGHALIFS